VRTKNHPKIALTSLIAIGWAVSASAGPYGDDLSKCLVAKTTEADRVTFVQWMFSALSLHPAVKPMATVSPEQLDNANKRTAELFTNLLTESCRDEVRAALKYEGNTAFQSSFQVLGQIAGRELLASPDVAAAMAGLEKYFDKEKFQAVMGDAE
jgi:hypothetical protein